MTLSVSSLPPMVPRWVSIWRAFKFVSNPIPILNENFAKYGNTYRFHIGGIREGIVTRDADVIKHVLQKNHRNYRKSNIQGQILAQFVGQGLLTSDGDFWLRQRRLIQPGFSRVRINALISLMQIEIRSYFDDLSHKIEHSKTIDIHREMHRLAFRIVAKTLFSTSIANDQVELLASQITELQAYIIKLVRQPYAKWWFALNGHHRKYLEVASQIRSTIRKVVLNRKRSGQSNQDLLQMLIDARYQDDGSPMSDEQILDECLIIFVAGHETSANALSWAVQLIGNDHSVLHRLQEELNAASNMTASTYDDLEKLQFTRQVINESLRLYPPGWVLDRVAIKDDEVGKWKIPAGSTIFLFVYGIHRSEDYWNDPNDFNPERFDPKHSKTRADYSYLPFGGGPRLCIGNHFDFVVKSTSIDVEPLITLRPKGGISIDLQPRGDH